MNNRNTPKLLLAIALLGASPLFAQTAWNVSTGGNWDTAGNWSPATVPNATDADARINNLSAAGAYTITASSAQNFTVGRLDLSTNSGATTNDIDLTLASNAGLIFASSGTAQLNFTTNNNSGSTITVNSPIQLNSNLTVTVTRTTAFTAVPTLAGTVNLQANALNIGSNNNGLRFTGLVSGTGSINAGFADHGSMRDITFANTGSTFSGGTTVGRNNRLVLGTIGSSFTGTGGGGILGTGTITVSGTQNNSGAATLQSNGGFLSSDYTDATSNLLGNTISIGSGTVLRVDANRPINLGDAAGDLTGSGRLVKVSGSGTGHRQLALNYANTGFTGTVEIQDGQVQTRVTDALATGSTITFNPQNSTNGVALQGGMATGTSVVVGSNLDFQRTASAHTQFISTSGGSTFEITGNFSNSGTGTAGYIGVGRGNGAFGVGGGGYAVGNNTGTATIILSGTGSLENNIGIVDGSSTQSILRLGNTTGTQTFTGAVSGNGDLVRNGTGGTSVLSGTNTYSGTTTVTAGTLFVNGSHTGGGNYSVTGTLGGSGTLTPAAAATFTVNSGGILAPGSVGGSIGTLTFDGVTRTGAVATFATDAKFNFDLNGTLGTSDRIQLNNGASGDLVFNGNVIDFTSIIGTLAANSTYVLFSANTVNAYSGLTLDGSNKITSGLTIGTGLESYTGSFLSVIGNDIVLTAAIPEPSSFAALAGLGALGLVGLRRRRRV